MLTTEMVRRTVQKVDEYLREVYKLEKEDPERDWRTYEEMFARKIKAAADNLRPLVKEATAAIQVYRGRGRKPKLTPEQKLLILLLKEIFHISNRRMAYMLCFFSLLSSLEVSPKIVERLYSDPIVEMGLHNLFVILLKKKGVKEVECAGDGTGYALTIEKHYRSVATKRKKEAKEQSEEKNKKRSFTYWFTIIDIETQMYISYGMSQKSEKEAFERAIRYLSYVDVEMKSIRLDKYFSSPTYVEKFGNTKVYVIPKKNATVRGGVKWHETLKEFVETPLLFLRQYFLRNYSESAFSADKKMLGWVIHQKREDRISTSLVCKAVWHNLFNLYPI